MRSELSIAGTSTLAEMDNDIHAGQSPRRPLQPQQYEPGTERQKGSSKPRAAKAAKPTTMINGHIVGQSIASPEAQRKLAARRKDKVKLLESYVKMGMLTPGGKLTKSYGG